MRVVWGYSFGFYVDSRIERLPGRVLEHVSPDRRRLVRLLLVVVVVVVVVLDDDVGLAWGIVLEEIRSRAGFNTRDFKSKS